MKALPYLLIFLTTFSLAQSDQNDSYHDGLEWRSVGPSRGGRATAIAGIPHKPFTFFMGTTGGGVWKTEDAGLTWGNISDGQIPVGSIGAIEVAPGDDQVIYVGTGSACVRGNISTGIGMYKSMDGGANWQKIGLSSAGQISEVIVHPDNPDVVWVAALGNVFGPNSERGVFKSTDGGATWKKTLFVNDSTGAADLIIHPENPRILFASMWQVERKPWTLIDGGYNGGVWKSIDGGDSWKKMEGGLPTGLLGKIALGISPANPNRMWALIQAAVEEDGGLYRSENGGKQWKRVSGDHRIRQRGWYYTHITPHPTDENTLYSNNTRLYKSIDGGNTVGETISTPHGDNHDIWINPMNPDIMINCNDGGANVSLNGGKSWSEQHGQPTSEFYRVTVDNQFPYRLYAGQQDNTTISVPSQNLGSLSDTEHWMGIGGGESADVAVDPRNPNIVYANTYSGELTYTNLETGEERQITAYPHYTEGTEMRDLKYRFQWNYPILVSKFNPDHIYQGSQYVMRTSNKGQDWEILSPDLTRNIEKYQDIPGGPIQHDATGVEVYSSIFALEESPIEEGVIWSGSDDGMVYVTTNGGQEWMDVTPKGIPYEATINKIEVSTHQKGRAIIAAYHYRYNDFKPYILLTNDYGKTWKSLTNGQNGIPNNHFVRAVAEDNKQKGLLYAGTEFGAYVSYNEGVSWEPLQMNLPVTPITDMEWHNNDLVISTQGRAFWILDDLTPIQERAQAEKASAYLYTPAPAYRTSVGGWSGLPAKMKVYMANEPTAKNDLKLFVIDAKQDTVKTWNGDDLKDLEKGINTLTWNLQYEAPEMAENFVAMVFSAKSARGPKAVPGQYTVGLISNGEVQTKPLEVKIDPRWEGITTADFQKQFDMSVEVRALIDESQDNIRAIRAVRNQLNDISDRAIKAGYSSSIKEQSQAIIEKLDALEDDLFQNKIETSQDEINYPRKWTNNIARLYQVLVGDDNKPTGGMVERWEDLKAEYEVFIAPYDGIMSNDVKAFNDLLAQENVSRIIVNGRD